MLSAQNLEVLITNQAKQISDQMPKVATWVSSEEDVRHECNKMIDEFLEKAGMEVRGRHEYGLAGGRIDSKYGGVIIEYKNPKGPQRITDDPTKPGNKAVLKQIKKRFQDFKKEENIEAERLFGLGCDGHTFVFVRYRSGRFEIEKPEPVTRHTVERLLRALVSLGAQGKSFKPEWLAADFGSESDSAQKGIREIYNVVLETESKKAKTFLNQWKILFGEVCGYDVEGKNQKVRKLAGHYGVPSSARPAELLFSVHTYYAIFMKLLAAEIASSFSPLGISIIKRCVETPTGAKLRGEMETLDQGGIWSQLGISNFLEGDLFSWYLAAWDGRMAQVVRNVVSTLDQYDPTTLSIEPAESRDLLKNLYQHLFPKSVRHDLGEYYTPDWLADHVLEELGYDGNPDKRLLDPGCGSGTFLVMAINRVKEWFVEHRHECGFGEKELIKKVLKNIIGFDLNPLAVMAARTNYLMAIRDLLKFTSNIELPVYLCDSIITPSEYSTSVATFKYRELKTAVGSFKIPKEVIKSRQQIAKYAAVIEFCVRNRYHSDGFIQRCQEEELPLSQENQHRRLYEQLCRLDAKSQNGIWARIIKNAFAPLFTERVDYVAGNPPWVNWNNLPDDYRAGTANEWKRFHLWPKYLMGASADFSQLFFYESVDAYLKKLGKIGFVITQTLFKTSGGNLFRQMKLPNGEGIGIFRVDDLVALQPFEGATNRTSVILAMRDKPTAYPVKYVNWTPKYEAEAISKEDKKIDEVGVSDIEIAVPVIEDLTSPWITGKEKEISIIKRIVGKNSRKAYIGIHTYGANAVYFVEKLTKSGNTFLVRNITKGAKNPVEQVESKVEMSLALPLVRGRDVKPFLAVPNQYIIFPYETDGEIIPESELEAKYPFCFAYLKSFKEHLSVRSQFKRVAGSSHWYQLFAVYPSTFSPYKVVWREQAASMTSAVISELDGKMVVPDHKLMFIPCKSEGEAHFCCSLLNSSLCRFLITKLAIETQITTKTIQLVSMPEYDPHNPLHLELATLSERCHTVASKNDYEKMNVFQSKIDEVASTLWGITEEEIITIQEALKQKSKNKRTKRHKKE